MRIKALLTALLLGAASPALATPALVQGASNHVTGTPTSGSVTLGSTITAGNTVVGCVVQGSGSAPTSISDGTNTYTLSNGSPFAGDQVTLFYKINAVATSSAITATFTTGTPSWLVVNEFSGISTSAAIDGINSGGTANNTSGTNSFSSGNLSPTPTVNGDLIWGCMSSLLSAGTFVPGTSPNFTSATSSSTNNVYSEYLVQATAASIAAAFTNSGSADYGWIGAVAFQASGGGGGVTHFRLTKDVGQ